jgi:hypothetical protein
MITTGVLGRSWRASVTEWGAVHPWPDTAADARPLEWFVAADDRWHVPATESTVRQQRVEGTPVVETRVRVPHGDVVHTVYSVADAGGLTVVEVTNESTLPVAVAFDRRGVRTERPIADVPIQGIELPAEAFVLPLGHRASVRVALAHAGPADGLVPDGLPTAMQVARGWSAVTDRASRFALPDGDLGAGLAAAVTAERCEVALGSIPAASDDPVGYAIAVGELVRMGEQPEHWLPELVDAVERIGPIASWEADVALRAAGRVLAVADERRAERDLARIVARRSPSSRPASPPSGLTAVPWLEGLFADGAALLPAGFPHDWLGQSVEAYGVPTGPRSTVSYAVRWHGARPAVLWEQSGEPVELRAPAVAPGWTAVDVRGEALWPDPANVS